MCECECVNVTVCVCVCVCGGFVCESVLRENVCVCM